ncbi:MAG: ComEA family DNA-binding protein, partial [Bacteroidota bacterium]
MKTIRNKGRLLPVLLFLLLSIALHAQQESHVEENPEKYFTDAESAAESGLIPYLELQDYHPEKPLDINKATAGELLEPGVISAQLIAGLISYREQLGPFLNNYELQAIPGWELEDIRKLLQYARVLTGIDTRQQQLSEGFLSGTNDLVVRWGTSGRNSDRYGQSLNSEGPYFTRALRYRHTFDGRMSYGITAESDPGEAIFRKSNRHGFDFYSAHLYIRQLGPRVRSLALGDYSARFGQGLLLQSGFAPGKSAETALLARNGRKINQYTAFGEALFFRGAGATLACGKKTELTVFYSSRRRDANTKVLYSPDSSRMETIFTSFQTSGLHRDSTEVADEKTVREQTGGVSLTYISQSGQISVNTLNILFDKSWAPAPAAYRLYTFRGRYLGAGSADYQWRYRNLFLFGETAVSGNGGVSTLNGAIASVHKNATITVLHRQLGARYQSVYAAPFAEVSGASNENGLFLGADVRWTRRWQINAYADVWRHPWLRFGADAPSVGWEYLFRAIWTPRRGVSMYV